MFVGNLSFDTTDVELRELFSQAGQVVSVSMPTDRETGRPRGFGFVEFASEQDAEAAITKLDGHELAGRALRVSEASERAPRGAPGAGGGDRTPGFGPDRRPAFRPRPKGSRRNLRSRKRSIW